MERWLLKSSCFELFGDGKYGLFLGQEVNGKDDIYWSRKSSCFERFGGGKYGLFLSQEVDGKMIFTGYREVLVLNFSVEGNTIFFQRKSWWKDDIYLVFLSFPWYSRTWETRFFVGWRVSLTQIFPYKDEIVDSILIGKIRVRENPSSGKIYSVIHLLRKVFVNWCFERKIIISTREGKNHINLLVQIFELILTFFSHNAKNDVFF